MLLTMFDTVAQRVVEDYEGYSIALIGCLASGDAYQGICMPDFIVFPSIRIRQMMVHRRGIMVRVLEVERPPPEESAWMIPISDPQMMIAAYKSSWRGKKMKRYMRRRAKRFLATSIDSAMKGMEMMEDPYAAYYYMCRSLSFLASGAVYAKGEPIRPSHITSQLRRLHISIPLPPADIGRRILSKRAGVLDGMLKESGMDVEGYLVGEKVRRLSSVGRGVDASMLLMYELSSRVKENVALAYVRDLYPTVDPGFIQAMFKDSMKAAKGLWMRLTEDQR